MVNALYKLYQVILLNYQFYCSIPSINQGLGTGPPGFAIAIPRIYLSDIQQLLGHWK